MEIAGGVFQWTEHEFWQTSLQYFLATVDGWVRANGGNKKSEISQSDYEATKREFAADLAMSDDDLARLREKRKGD